MSRSQVRFGPNPSPILLFLIRALLAIERRLTIGTLRIVGRWPADSGWNWSDSFFTPHNKSFMADPRFLAAYSAAVGQAGRDYRIPWRVHQALWCASVAAPHSGDFIELGTGRGFIMAAVLRDMSPGQLAGRAVYLCDFFSKPKVSGAGIERFADVYAKDVRAVASLASAYPSVQVLQGDVLESVAKLKSCSFSFVHVDLNSATAETGALNQIWDQIVDGGVILLDDYANQGLEDQWEAMNRFFLAKHQRILTTAAGQGIVIKVRPSQ